MEPRAARQGWSRGAPGEEAIAERKSRVDAWFATEHKPGMRAQQLWEQHTCFGEDPWVLGGKLNDRVPFRAWDYARRRCAELCTGGAK